MSTVAALPAVSFTVTLTLAVLALAMSGVPLMTPLPASMLNPDGSPGAPYSWMPKPTVGFIPAIATPTCNDEGAVYVGAVGTVRSTASVLVREAAGVYPAFAALTLTATLGPAMYAAFLGTSTDQIAGLAAEEVAVNGVVPTVTVTVTPPTDPVSPEIANPAARSAMFTVPSVAIAFTFSTSVPAATTVTVNVSVASS